MRRYDHRSPVQPGSSRGWWFAAGAALAALLWGVSQKLDSGAMPAPRAAEEAPPRGNEREPVLPDPPTPMEGEIATSAKANLVRLFSDDDYPDEAIRHEEQGAVGFRLTVGADGRAADCTIVESSGFRSLDNATCRILTSRLRAKPARDRNGKPVPDTMSGRIKWVLPDA